MPPKIYSAFAPQGLPDYEQQRIDLAAIQQRQQALRDAVQQQMQRRALELEEQGTATQRGYQQQYLDFLRGESQAGREHERELAEREFGFRERGLGLQERLGMAEIGLSRQKMEMAERQAGRELSSSEKIAMRRLDLQEQGLSMEEAQQRAAQEQQRGLLDLKERAFGLEERAFGLQEEAARYQRQRGALDLADKYQIDLETGLPAVDEQGRPILSEAEQRRLEEERRQRILSRVGQNEALLNAIRSGTVEVLPGSELEQVLRESGVRIPEVSPLARYGRRQEEIEAYRQIANEQLGNFVPELQALTFDSEEDWEKFSEIMAEIDQRLDFEQPDRLRIVDAMFEQGGLMNEVIDNAVTRLIEKGRYSEDRADEISQQLRDALHRDARRLVVGGDPDYQVMRQDLGPRQEAALRFWMEPATLGLSEIAFEARNIYDFFTE